jgi:primosomal protein N'
VLLRGPAPAPLERLRGRYRWQIVLSASRVAALHAAVQTRAAPGAHRPRPARFASSLMSIRSACYEIP